MSEDDNQERDIFGELIPVPNGNGELDLTTSTQALLAGLGNVQASAPAVGTGLNFMTLDKGNGSWYHGPERITTDPNGEAVVALHTLKHGWVAWLDAKVAGEEMVSAGERVRPATDLPNVGARWEAARSVQLRFISGEDEGLTVLYKTNSDGGMKWFSALIDAVRRQCAINPRENYPVIQLASEFYMHQKFGKTFKPVLRIVRWIDPRAGRPTPVAAASKQAPLAGAAVDDVLPAAKPSEAGRRRRVGA